MAAEDEIIINAVLAGTREYLANAQRIAASNEEIATSTDMIGRAQEATTRRSYLMNQALFTVRRLLYGVTLTTIASGLAAVKWGFDFNSAMQQARVALGPVFGGTQALNRELTYLFNFTKYTPFQFKDMTIAFRQMYFGFRALGMNADFTNQVLKAMVDNLSATGRTTPGALNRVSVALQHMANLGHLTGQSVQQLARDGIQIMPALRKELGLTADQMHNIGKMGIPVDAVLRAIVKYTESTPGLMNAAHRQAIHTFHGLFTTFRDNMAQIMGAVEGGWFKNMQGLINRVNNFFNSLHLQGSHSITDIVTQLNNRLTPGGGLLMIWHQLYGVVHDFWLIFSTLMHDLVHSTVTWGLLVIALGTLHGLLAFIVPQVHMFTLVLKILLPLWIAWFTVTKLQAIWLAIVSFEEVVLKKRTQELTFVQSLYVLWINRSVLAEKLGITYTLLYGAVMREASLATWTLTGSIAAALTRLRLLRLGLLGMAGLTITAIVLLDLIPHARRNPNPNAPSNVPLQHALTRLPILGGFFSQVGRAADWESRQFHRLGHLIGFQGGGWTPYSGQFMVGERGPELVTLPQGSHVAANGQLPQFNMRESWMNRGADRQPIILKIGERVLEAVVVDLNTGRLARS